MVLLVLGMLAAATICRRNSLHLCWMYIFYSPTNLWNIICFHSNQFFLHSDGLCTGDGVFKFNLPFWLVHSNGVRYKQFEYGRKMSGRRSYVRRIRKSDVKNIIPYKRGPLQIVSSIVNDGRQCGGRFR